MAGVLIDTSSLIDLALRFDRDAGDSAGRGAWSFRERPLPIEAIEALVLYDDLRVDGPSFDGFCEGSRTTEYYRRFVTAPDQTRDRLRQLKTLCKGIEVTAAEVAAIYLDVALLLDRCLATARQENFYHDETSLYAGLPYHLGDDSTAQECQILGAPSSDLEHILESVPPGVAKALQTFVSVLHDHGHPSRAAWALPMIRLLYYQALQHRHTLHLIPHPTKAAFIGSGRRQGSVGKSIIDYFDNKVRSAFEKRKQEVLGTSELAIPLPLLAENVLRGAGDWDGLMARVAELRGSTECRRYRQGVAELTRLLAAHENVRLDEVMADLEAAAVSWQQSLKLKPQTRRVRITIPFVGVSSEFEVPYRKFPAGISGDLLIFVHRLLGGRSK